MEDFIAANLISLNCKQNTKEERCLSIGCFYDEIIEVNIRNWEGEISKVFLNKEQIENMISHLNSHLQRLNEDKYYAERKGS